MVLTAGSPQTGPTSPLTRRFSSVNVQLKSSSSSSSLLALPSAGADSASKARQLRHASTFNVRFDDPDVRNASLLNLLRRHLQTQAAGPGARQQAEVASRSSPITAASNRLSARVERAMQLRDQCERELERYCDAKLKPRRGSLSPLSPSIRADLLDKSYCLNPDIVHDNHQRDKEAFDRLMRKLSPAMKNSATTHGDLVHMLQGCSECAMRATFCARCSRKASEFFENFTVAELQALYGGELPPPDEKALEAFADSMAQREHKSRWRHPIMEDGRDCGNMEGARVPARDDLMRKLAQQQSEMLREYTAMQQRALVMEERAKAAEERAVWATKDSDDRGNAHDERAEQQRQQQLQTLMRENERLHAQLVATRMQLSDEGRIAAERNDRITELEAQLEKEKRTTVTIRANKDRDQQQIKALRASVRALEKELINIASGR